MAKDEWKSTCFLFLAAQWVQTRRILLTPHQVKADVHTRHRRREQQVGSSLTPLPLSNHSRWRDPSLRRPQPVWYPRWSQHWATSGFVSAAPRLASLALFPSRFCFPCVWRRKNSPCLPVKCSPAEVGTWTRAWTAATARGSSWATTRPWGRLPAWPRAPPASSRSWPTSPTRPGRTPGSCVYSSSAAGEWAAHWDEGWGGGSSGRVQAQRGSRVKCQRRAKKNRYAQISCYSLSRYDISISNSNGFFTIFLVYV